MNGGIKIAILTIFNLNNHILVTPDQKPSV